MQVEEGGGTTSSTMMDPWSIFLYGMNAPMTREKYRGRLAKFFDFIGLTEGRSSNSPVFPSMTVVFFPPNKKHIEYEELCHGSWPRRRQSKGKVGARATRKVR